ncbi:MAG: Formate dehydrogenase H [Syntrophorhabdus sp. PtaU1.Bin153]|nr:MAG: Formate dehydrogenase H [Syntrophorhabdus sp. PtaU1.Bin153]
MSEKLKITINDKEYEAAPGQMILDVVREHAIDTIPTLCFDPKLPPYGSCYLCVVEVKGLEKLIPSCSSPVSNGMVVYTNNERIRESRKTALELLLSNHYADCLGPCKNTCPAGVDVQGYIALMSMGKYREAVRLIKDKNPLPLVCGRVCVRECETACRRNLVDDPVGIDYLKRFAADNDIEDPWQPELSARNGKKIAIVGGGPAGLTCAYFLTLKGYSPTIFEKSPQLGGMLRYGIPEYRLPKAMLDREITWITDLGVEVKTNATLGEDFTIESLKKDGFDAVFLSIGAQKAKRMGIDGEDATEGVIGGADFLRQMQSEKKPAIYGKVVVVGGGNTAIDAARTSLRLGAEKVTILYRRTRKEMPANDMEIEAADEEGVEMVFLSAPTGIVAENGRLTALRCIRMELGAPDASGRRSPVPKEGSEYDLPCDFAISAIGQDIDLGNINGDGKLKASRQNAITTNGATFETSIPGVFAGGDAVTGPAVAIDAIAHGRIAALMIDQYIQTGKPEPHGKAFVSRKEVFGEIPESEFAHLKKIERERMPELPVAERIKNLDEVEVGFSVEQVRNETGRCLECGCSAYFDCDLREYATEFGVDLAQFTGDVRKYRVDKDHPFITLDPNKCINCGRCVRTCSEILQVAALGFVNRGFKSVVKPSMEKKLLQTNCISCGNCIDACPTGAITEKVPFAKPGPWRFTDIPSVCSFCSVGCNIAYRVFHDGVFSVSSASGSSHNKGYLCTKGRFGYQYMVNEDRLTQPMIKRKGQLQPANWEEALSYTAQKLRSIMNRYGNQAVAFFGSPRMTNEELYLLQKLARVVVKTNNVGSFTNLINGIEQDGLDDMFGITTSTTTMDQLPGADVVLVMNADLSEDNLVAELKIKAARKTGTRLVMINSSEVRLNKYADLWVNSKRGTNTVLVNGIAKAVIDRGLADRGFVETRTEGYEDFRQSVVNLDPENVSEITGVETEKFAQLIDTIAKTDLNVIVVYNVDSVWEKSHNDLKALGNLMMLTGRVGKPGNGIIVLRDFANSQGLLDMGVNTGYLPGNVRPENTAGVAALSGLWGTDLKTVFTPVDLKEQLEKEAIKALVIFGEDPLYLTSNLRFTGGAEFTVVVDSFMTSTATEADVVLPASLPTETSGSYTACDRRVQSFPRIFEPKTGMETWQVIAKLAEELGSPFALTSVGDIAKEIQEANPFYKEGGDSYFWGNGFLTERFVTQSGKGRFMVLPIGLTPFSLDKKPYLASEQYVRVKIKGRLTT